MNKSNSKSMVAKIKVLHTNLSIIKVDYGGKIMLINNHCRNEATHSALI
jgi:hypothetical protein